MSISKNGRNLTNEDESSFHLVRILGMIFFQRLLLYAGTAFHAPRCIVVFMLSEENGLFSNLG